MSQAIRKSPADSRLYRYGALPNRLRYLLVSDPEADKSAAAVDVHAGSVGDPASRPGLAHFCEHMLFMGTEGYPGEAEFFEYLKQHAGSHNAYTDLLHTNYFFDAANPAFLPALDRFSHFFKTPLFSAGATSREMKAVHSENAKNLQSDLWRSMQLFRSEANPDSPLCRFATGNLETLDFPSTRDDLLEFHKKHYSANIMNLVLYSDRPLDELEAAVTDHFAAVPDQDLPTPDCSKQPPAYDERNLGYFYKVKPVLDRDQLKLVWILPRCLESELDSKPHNYVSHLLGHEGPNSLLSALQQAGLAMELGSYAYHQIKAFTVVGADIRLTAKGLAEYPRVLELVYSYLKQLREAGPQEWLFS